MDPYIDLLETVGVVVSPDEWEVLHAWRTRTTDVPDVPAPFPHLPVDPVSYDTDARRDAVPVFTRSQCNECAPEVFGWDRYRVIEDREAAWTVKPSYEQEVSWKRWHRPIHRYDRPYRIRRTLLHVIGQDGTCPPDLLAFLKARLPVDLVLSRSIYERVRSFLKKHRWVHLYASIPYIVSQLGGSRWRVTGTQYQRVYADALQLHRLFDLFRSQDRLGLRRRFPKMQFVILRLLHRHGVVPPYFMPWARTYIKRRQLRTLLITLETQPCYPPNTPETTAATPPGSPNASDRTTPTCTVSSSATA
jgi:hypothetical protein